MTDTNLDSRHPPCFSSTSTTSTSRGGGISSTTSSTFTHRDTKTTSRSSSRTSTKKKNNITTTTIDDSRFGMVGVAEIGPSVIGGYIESYLLPPDFCCPPAVAAASYQHDCCHCTQFVPSVAPAATRTTTSSLACKTTKRTTNHNNPHLSKSRHDKENNHELIAPAVGTTSPVRPTTTDGCGSAVAFTGGTTAAPTITNCDTVAPTIARLTPADHGDSKNMWMIYQEKEDKKDEGRANT